MADLIDVLSLTGLRTGERLTRQEIHRLGKPHRAVHLYIVNLQNELLLQRRSSTVDHAQNQMSISLTGHVGTGEHSSCALRRELHEELGVNPSALRIDFLFSYYQEAFLSDDYIDRQFNDVYFAKGDISYDMIRLNKSEVREVRFVPISLVLDMIRNGSDDIAPFYRDECEDIGYYLRTSLFSD